MSSFCLHLTESDQGISLQSTEFKDAETSAVTWCRRGSNNFRLNSGTFAWSQGVQGLCELFLAVKIAALDSRQGFILGERGSLAASLDYSIAKNGQWLADMFGAYSDGTLRARRILRRINPERKRPGPVEIFLNPAIISAHQVTIRLDGKVLETRTELSRVREMLVSALVDHATMRGYERGDKAFDPASDVSPHQPILSRGDWLESVLREEVTHVLNATDIFCPRTLRNTLANIFEDPYLSKHLPKNGANLLWEQSAGLSRSALAGLNKTERANCQRQLRPLTIASPVFLTGAIGLLTYLKRTRSLDINVDYVFYRSGEILEEGSAGRRGDLPDGFVCSAASLPDMLKRASRFDYVPLMLLPGVSSRVVSGGAQSNKTRAAKVQQLLVIGDLPTSGSIYAQKLVRSRVDRGAKIEITAVDAKTFEDSAPPHDEDFGLVMGFPTYHYHHRVNRSAFTDMPKSRENQLETVLFIKQELISDGTAIILDVMIRDAWLEVKEMPSKLSQLTSLIVDDTAYIKALNRLGGFYKVSDRTMNL